MSQNITEVLSIISKHSIFYLKEHVIHFDEDQDLPGDGDGGSDGGCGGGGGGGSGIIIRASFEMPLPNFSQIH